MSLLKKAALLFISVFFLATSLYAKIQTNIARPDSQVIKQMLIQRDNEIKTLLGPEGSSYTSQQKKKLKNIINGVVDFGAMAKVALQNTYGTLSTQKREEFVDVFSKIIKDQSLNKLDIYRAKVQYRKIAVNKDTARVETIATLKNVRTPVAYEMARENGKWFITDFSIDNVSTAQSYKRSFQSFLAKKGYDALFAALKKRAAR